jgi:hypothetical protein
MKERREVKSQVTLLQTSLYNYETKYAPPSSTLLKPDEAEHYATLVWFK